MLGELALQRAHGGARGLARAGIDEIRDGFGLREIDLVVEKRALREFAGPRAARAELQQRATRRSTTTGPPWPCSSSTCSPV